MLAPLDRSPRSTFHSAALLFTPIPVAVNLLTPEARETIRLRAGQIEEVDCAGGGLEHRKQGASV
jgi:hypothetical protein